MTNRAGARLIPTSALVGTLGPTLVALALGGGLLASCAGAAPPPSARSTGPSSPAPSAYAARSIPSEVPSLATPTALPASATTPGPSAAIGTDVGDRAPDFALRDLRGQKVSLAALHGRPVWLMFWAPGCVSCEPTLLEANRVQAQNASSDLAVVSVAVSTLPEDAKWYSSSLELAYPVALDENGQVFTRYRAVTLPAHVWIDRNGIIRDWAEGEVPPDVLAAGVAKILPGG